MTQKSFISSPTKAAVSVDQWLRQWSEHNQNAVTVETAYSRVAWFRRAVDAVANTTSAVPFAIYRGNEVIARDSDYQLLNLPFRWNLPKLVNELAGDLVMYGRGNWTLAENAYGYTHLVRLHPAKTEYLTTTSGDVYAYEYRSGTYWKRYSVGVALKKGGSPAVWLTNRTSDNVPGSPPALAALAAAGMLDAIAKYGKAFFDAGGMGAVLVSAENYAMAPESEQARVRSWFERASSGLQRAFKPLVTGTKFDVKPLGQSAKEIEMPELSREKREDVAGAIGVPFSVIFAGAANYATANVDKLNFYDMTISPLLVLLQDALNEGLFSEYGLKIVFEPQRLEVYQASELEKAMRLDSARARGDVSRNEWREIMNLPPLPDSPVENMLSPAIEVSTPAVPQLPAPKPAAEDAELADDFSDAVRAWERKALRRIKDGKPERALEFTSTEINPVLHAAIVGGLEAAGDVETVKAVFAGALAWRDYP